MNKYYVYLHIDPRTEKPFYVGKGMGNRKKSDYGRNKGWKEQVADIRQAGLEYDIKTVGFNLSETDALNLEYRTIIELIQAKHKLVNRFLPKKESTSVDMELQILVLSSFIRERRQSLGYSQKEFALRSGVGFRFLKELESGRKQNMRLDKINQVLYMFGHALSPVPLKSV